MKTINKKDIGKVLEYLAKEYSLYAPVSDDKITYDFELIEDEGKVELDFANTQESPKKLFFPQYEVLFRYDKDGKTEVPEIETEKKTVIFGMRPCDVRALLLLDKVFDDKKFQDPYYLKRRENTVIFTMGCNSPAGTCFCTSFGFGPFAKEGGDVLVADLGDTYVFEPVTEKGEKVLKDMPGVSDATKDQAEKLAELSKQAEQKIKKKIELEGLPEKLEESYDDSVWDSIHEKCVQCGICSFMCPTCHCFDMIEETHGSSGERVRIWDTCMSCSFTKEASGHNPRPSGKERMRQRVNHKFRYFPEKFGEFLCTGCGRCIKNCPVCNDIVKILERVKKVQASNAK